MQQNDNGFGNLDTYRAIFFEEAQEHLAAIEAHLLRLEPANEDRVRTWRAFTSLRRGHDGNAIAGEGSDPVVGAHFDGDGATEVAVAITSYRNDQRCVANDSKYRLDTPSARTFLGQFVSLP